MSKIINLTADPATPEQIIDGVEDLPIDGREKRINSIGTKMFSQCADDPACYVIDANHMFISRNGINAMVNLECYFFAEYPDNDHPYNDHPDNDHPDNDHPDNDHPDNDHPDNDHPDNDHPDKDHPDKDHPDKDHPDKDIPQLKQVSLAPGWYRFDIFGYEIKYNQQGKSYLTMLCQVKPV